MNENERYEIATLAEAAHLARERYYYAGMMQSPPAGTPEAVKAAIDYELIRTEMMQAEGALIRAQRRLAEKTTR